MSKIVLYSQFKSLVVSLSSDYILKISDTDERERKSNYRDLSYRLKGICIYSSDRQISRDWGRFCRLLSDIGVDAPRIFDFLEILVGSTVNEHHEWKSGDMHGVVIDQLRTMLGDKFPSEIEF
jgi:hypothetical protein